MKIAIIGAGISGNVVARLLCRQHEITVFEAGDHIGGHSHTHQVEVGGRSVAVDTGFIVYNDLTYPRFSALLAELRVPTRTTAMSFSVRNEVSGLEYASASLNTLFAQRSNLLRPRFHRMWAEILRFNRNATEFHDAHGHHELTLGDYVREQRYSGAFVRDYLVPMASAIWSAAPADIGAMPARFLIGFFRNHGMLSINDRPQGRTVCGGSAPYVARLVAPFRARIRLRTAVLGVRRDASGVWLRLPGGERRHFDRVFLACHSDQALALLEDASEAERAVLGAMPYQENEVVLHTDESLMPRQRRAWAAWNYHVTAAQAASVRVTYNMNILQALPTEETVCVTLNRSDAIDPRRVLRRLSYQHPVFTRAAVAAQARLPEINGVNCAYFCGAYARFGFHEDGVASAEAALASFATEGSRAQRALHRLA
ncbi:MAG: FAD-dependent oxidoreductase [Gammaproteobacteria bacterium]|nr:FAD-dependent oxidoreductase [Gammaproteobacteria bacterium]